MKSVRLIGASALFLLLGIGLPAYAGQNKPDEHGGGGQAAKPAQQARPAQQQQQSRPAQQQAARPAQQPQPAKPAQQQQQTRAAKPQQQAKPAQQQQQTRAAKPQQQAKPAQQQQQARAAKPQQQAKPAQQQQQGHVQRTAAQQQTQRSQPAIRESGRTSGRIPDDRFRSNFGQDHHFRMGNPQMVGGYSRFQYGGFWFGFVQPWPSDWYYGDDVYIDYIDGEYFMFDPYYPGERVEISVVL
jgi:outer membrane biosynthesis protein TonB